MKKKFNLLGLLAVFSLFAASAPAQSRIIYGGKCSGKIYGARDVTRRARIIEQPNFNAIYEPFGRDVHAHVSLEAVLCRSGRATDIRVVESAPPNVGEFVAAAVSLMRFAPAEMNWHTVSQRQRFEFLINDSGIREIAPGDAAGRLVEAVNVMGNRRLSKEEILSWVHTRPGEHYSQDQLTGDLNAVLATGYFDKLGTRVTTEDGIRGGVVVTFEVFELPLISEVKFEGLKDLTESVILDALLKENIDVRKGAVYDPVKVRSAVRVIGNLLESKGQGNANVEVLNENITATAIVLTFVIR